MIRLALFISGTGSTACSIIRACRNYLEGIKPVLVVASKKGIIGIENAKKMGFPARDIIIADPGKFRYANDFADFLITECKIRKVNLVGQYGWLPLTPKKFIKKYKNLIINQHPGPLDQRGIDFGGKGMYGRRVHCTLLYFRRMTGHDFWTEATSHLVTEEFDRGMVIGRTKIPITNNDTVESLQKKVLPEEHNLQINILKKFAKQKINTLTRKNPLIIESEIKILEESKKIAKILYPNG